jgi:hypothetical protein
MANYPQTKTLLATQVEIELMLADLDLGSALIEAFHYSEVATTKARNLASALKAYEIVSEKALWVEMSPENDENIRAKLKSLADQLRAVGERV